MPEVKETIRNLADAMITRFTPPEFWPGCEVKSIADKDEYTTDNGWIEAIVGPHGQQRVRYLGFPHNVGTANFFVDVEYFPIHKLYRVFGPGQGGTATAGGLRVDKVYLPNLTGTALYTDAGGTINTNGDMVSHGFGYQARDAAGTLRVDIDPGDASTGSRITLYHPAGPGGRRIELLSGNLYSILFDPGAVDDDINLFMVDVAGTPFCQWGETSDRFQWNKGHEITAGDLRVASGHATAKANGFIVKNTSGATATAGDVGYLDENNEYKTTTTAEDERPNPVAVLVGAANNSDIYVTKGPGRATLNYAGPAPSSGDFLTFSTTAGSAQARSTMHPGVLARARANGAGGTVEVELLLRSVFIPLGLAVDIYSANGVSDSDFVATIDSLPGGAAVRYDTPSSGSEDNLTPNNTNHAAKMVLHNTTRGDSALISDNDETGGAGYDGEITLTAAVPGTWQVGDTITTRSQTNTTNITTSYFADFEITSTDIPETVRAWSIGFATNDSGAANELLMIHPYESNVSSKRLVLRTQTASVSSLNTLIVPNLSGQFCGLWSASGASTQVWNARLRGVIVAV